jgi:hypothetical protein
VLHSFNFGFYPQFATLRLRDVTVMAPRDRDGLPPKLSSGAISEALMTIFLCPSFRFFV